MKRLKNAWWWLWHGSKRCGMMFDRVVELERLDEQRKASIVQLEQAFVELMNEVNALRSAPPIQQAAPNARVVRHWREFRSAAEGRGPVPGAPQPISHERTS